MAPGADAGGRSGAAGGLVDLRDETPSPRSVSAWSMHVGSEVDPVRLRAELTLGDLPACIGRAAAEAGPRPAVTIEEDSITHGELDRRAARVAGWLNRRGVGIGDRVVLCAQNSVALVVAHLGIMRAGGVTTLAGPTLTERELRDVAETSGAIGAFGSGEATGRLRALAADTTLGWVVSLDEEAGGPRLEETVEAGPDAPVAELDGGQLAILAFTSGTTGKPKGAPLTHANLLSSVRGVMLAWRWRADDVLVHTLPLHHLHGLTGLHATLLSGSRAHIHASMDSAWLARTVASERASVLFAVPAVYDRLLSWEGAGDVDFSPLRLATSGSAPLSPVDWERARETLDTEPLERFGTTESGLDVSNPYDGPRIPGSVGMPLPGVEIAIVDDRGEPLADGSEGEILARGPQVFHGYWRDDRASAESFRAGGWFRTGDVGRVDPSDARLWITGRLKELIITGGMNVYPREVEHVLEAHPSVARAAVVGVPSPRWGEEVVAFVVPAGAGGIDEHEIRSHARELLAPYKCPKAVHSTDELPVNAVGKVQRAELVELGRRLR